MDKNIEKEIKNIIGVDIEKAVIKMADSFFVTKRKEVIKREFLNLTAAIQKNFKYKNIKEVVGDNRSYFDKKMNIAIKKTIFSFLEANIINIFEAYLKTQKFKKKEIAPVLKNNKDIKLYTDAVWDYISYNKKLELDNFIKETMQELLVDLKVIV